MRLDSSDWVFSAGLTSGWRALTKVRVEQALAKTAAIARAFDRQAPAAVRRAGYGAGVRYFLRRPCRVREGLARHPAYDYWLFLWDKHFGLPGPVENWRMQFGLYQGLAATLALSRGERLSAPGTADEDGHFHLYGSGLRVELPASHALRPLLVGVEPEGLTLAAPRWRGLPAARWTFSRSALEAAGGERGLAQARLAREPEVAGGISVASCGLLLVQGVVMHGLAKPTQAELRRFAAPLARALDHIRERDQPLHDEMTDLVRVLVPLANPKNHGSVSSSYVNLRGAVCLSPSDDALLQAETLIHEFCHQKMNSLLLVEPILRPGQAGQVFFSPWRPDARRLRGLILGAHAFLNVASYLIKSLSREDFEEAVRSSVMSNAARRLWEVDAALRTAIGYGRYTPFGSDFLLGMSRSLQTLFHAAQRFPEAIIEEGRRAVEERRRRHALPLTGIHRRPR